MSKHTSSNEAPSESVTLETGLDALRSSPEFRGPAEPSDDHSHANGHFALIYESQEEQFAAAIPFIRQGLERGERCLYVTHENSRDEVVAAMRAYDIDVDAVLDSGALSIHGEEETYLRNGTFDADETIEFLDAAIEEATEEYEALRVTGEMSSVLREDPDAEDLIECEAKANYLFDDVDGLALCQYNRERFPSDVIRDVISTHPLLIHDNRVSHNVYYTPPGEFLDPEKSDREVDQLLGALREQTDAKATFQQRERSLNETYQIMSDPDLGFDEKLQALFDLGCEQFGLELGAMAKVDPGADRFEVEYVSTDHEHFECGLELPLSETYCTAATDIGGVGSVDDPIEAGYDDIYVHREFDIKTYLGTYIEVDGDVNRTFFFVSEEPRDSAFSDTEHTFQQLLGQWVKYELERQQREEFLHESYDITSDATRSFEAKLDALCDLGCEQFGLDLGGLAKVDPDTDRFEVEMVSGEHDHLVPGARVSLSETYCRVAADGDSAAIDAEPVAVTDPVSDGFEDNLCYEQFGVRTYLGTYLEIDGDTDRTFWFVSNESRDDPITDTERTFLDLMGQWVKYELERRQREQELRERTEHLRALVETAPECIKTVAADGTLLQMNPAGLDMVEANSASDVIDECVYDLIAPEHREMFREFNERICRGESETLEFDIVGLEGTRRHMETHAAPFRRPDGTISQVALTRDITEQVERKRELERALDLLERTERIADVGGWEIDPETTEVFWTDHIFDLLDAGSGEEPPLDEALDMYHEEDRSIVEDAVEKGLDSGDSFDVEVRLRTAASSEVRWLRVQGVPEIVDDEVVSFRGAAQDVTEHKQREQRLEELIDRLEASNERLEQFAYAASHDLQEPLRMVSSYLQLLERRYEDALDAEGEEFLEFAVDGADRMRNMIEGLLAYSRVEMQGDPLEPIDLDVAFDDVLSDLQFQIEESNAEITAGDLPRVEGDASQLRQVFQNLLENAITYSGDDPPRIRVSAERDGSEWIVSVRDEGVGIDPDDQDRIFEVFQRLHSRDEHSGTGIGLALCRRIVERHGGDIRVESEPFQGTTFSFTLPAVQNHDQ